MNSVRRTAPRLLILPVTEIQLLHAGALPLPGGEVQLTQVNFTHTLCPIISPLWWGFTFAPILFVSTQLASLRAVFKGGNLEI